MNNHSMITIMALSASLVIPAAFANPSFRVPSFALEKIPAGRLKEKLAQLPAPAQEKALQWLASFPFPEQDYEQLNVDNQGGIFYEDTELPDEISQADLEADPTLVGISPVDAFKLHSKPGAPNQVYLNFKGFNITNTGWNNGGLSSYQALPFDLDGNMANFSTGERQSIAEIWHRIAEDYAAFNIDVTTEHPGSFGPNTGHVLITKNVDSYGNAMPYSTAGGVAYVGVWGLSYFTSYQPALVYQNNLANAPFYIAEAASHELGHNLGLSHDGTSTAGYYTGHGSGNSSWAPIMGVGYYQNVTQWSRGEYPDANNTQDDLAIISNQLQYRNDDHGNTANNATELLTDSEGFIASSDPEFDPLNQRTDNKGIIETRSDVDVFAFDTGTGAVNLEITPAWAAYTRSNLRGANLDIKARLLDASGALIAEDDVDGDTDGVIAQNLAAGRYFLEISGVGDIQTPYSDYGSQGMYFISGQVVPYVVSQDSTPPSPAPVIESIQVDGRNQITVTSTAASDESGSVQYQFLCNSSGNGCIDSAWQNTLSYSVNTLQADTEYGFQVKARDIYGNETLVSDSVIGKTEANLIPVAQDDNASTDQNVAVSINVLSNDTDGDGDSLSIQSVTDPALGNVSVTNQNQIIYMPLGIGNDSFSYTITDGYGGIASAVVDIFISAVNQAPVANPDSAEVAMSGSVTVDVLANDSDPEGQTLTLVSVSSANKGSADIINGQIVYSAGSKRGTDTLTYTIEDLEGLTSTGTVTISIVRSVSDGTTDSGSTGGGKCNRRKTSC